MAKTPAERKAAEYERNKKAGLLPRHVWVHPDRLNEYRKVRERLKKPLRDKSRCGNVTP